MRARSRSQLFAKAHIETKRVVYVKKTFFVANHKCTRFIVFYHLPVKLRRFKKTLNIHKFTPSSHSTIIGKTRKVTISLLSSVEKCRELTVQSLDGLDKPDFPEK